MEVRLLLLSKPIEQMLDFYKHENTMLFPPKKRSGILRLPHGSCQHALNDRDRGNTTIELSSQPEVVYN